MGVLMYSPGVKVYIDTQDNGILDISDDLISGNMARRSEGISTFTFTLQNTRRKYDGIFAPNDRIICLMKRITWLRTFTGYLNAVPLVTAWPQPVQLTASCSLKKLQYWYWDPGLASTQALIASALTAVRNPDDGGVSNAVITILNNVVGWPPEKIHIAGIPQAWFRWAYKIAKNVEAETAQADQLAQQFYATLSGNGTIGGVAGGGTVRSGALPAGTYGGQSPIDQDQAANAVLIYNTAVTMGGTTADAMIGIMTAWGESGLANIQAPNSAGAYGLFQQRPSQGWGTVAQVTNAQYAAKAFYRRELAIRNRASLQPSQVAWDVQRPGVSPSYYAGFQEAATQVVNILAGGAGTSLGSDPTFRNTTRAWKAGHATGQQLLQTMISLVTQHPNIPYQMGGDSAPNVAVPTLLDCSSAMQWAVFQTLGTLAGFPRTSQDQQAYCQNHGKIISADDGMKIQGALMFAGIPAHHVEMSLGDGVHTVGAHSPGTDAGVVTSSGYWTNAGLPTNLIDYSGSGVPFTGGTPSGGFDSGVQLGSASGQPWYNPSDPFDKLFGSTPWVPVFDISTETSEALTGVRALLNDQPVLPYLKNLLFSTMRSFSSAPNGDFISWFPDYYGLWGTAAIMRLEPIELQDFTVYWDDSTFVTHQYTVAPVSQQLDLQAATVENIGPLLAVTTTGIATIDIPAIMYALFGLEPTKADAQKFINYIYKRFGARPDYEQMPGVVGPSGEFFSALFLFMRNWAYQYNADIPLTFMPEMWPGMLAQIPAYGFQAYVTTVNHSFQLGPGGFFQTSINIAAPARLPGSDGNSGSNLIGLPIAGGLVAAVPSLPGTTGGGGSGGGGGRKN